MTNFNPTVKEFLEKKQDLTLIGLYWAGYWRFFVAVWGIVFLVTLFFAIMGKILS